MTQRTPNPERLHAFSRREFLRLGAAAAACACLPGSGISGSVFSGLTSGDPERILVLLQLSGGNDGLSTVVPFADDAYHRARRATRIEPKEVIRLTDAVGLHPNLKSFRGFYDRGHLAVVMGVGYPEPNRSHFESMDIWHSANHTGRNQGSGWIGRWADAVPDASADTNMVVHIGGSLPWSVHASRHQAIAFSTPDQYRWIASDSEERALGMATSRPVSVGRDSALEKIRRTINEARESSRSIREAAERYRPKVAYPGSQLAASLRTVAALIAGRIPTRVFSVETSGFDTHVGQRGRHDALMTGLSEALGAFFQDLAAQGAEDRVVLMAFSEFGRRLEENASGGTDHGVAGPMFLVGGGVRGGLFGRMPSLTDLDGGDLRHTIDFRSVYASVISGWLRSDADRVLGAPWPRIDLFPA